jgi:cell division protease FtsH
MQSQQGQNKFSKYSFLIIIMISFIVFSLFIRNPMGGEQQKISYSEFLNLVESKKVSEVSIINSSNKLKGTLTDKTRFMVDAPTDADLVKTLRANNIKFTAENPGLKENAGQFLAVIIVPVVLILAIWFLIMRQANVGGGQAMSFGRSKAKVLTDNLPKVSFKDVAGVDEAIEELKEIVEFLKDPGRFQKMGAKIPKGVLLLGPPGSGKTLLARAIAGEAQVPFFHMSGSDFVEMFVGVGASRVRDLFDQAKKNAPCLVFVDEIDAVGRQRGAGLGGGHDEREQTLNQLLVEMDGFDANKGVILIAATNRPDVLDPALLRPGRFDRRVVVDRPDLNGRRAILDVHAKGKPLDPAVDLDVIARRTPGFTGADLENVLNEAAILAARENAEIITGRHIEESIDRNIAGPERRSRLLSDKDRKVTAYHEAGHALVAKMLPDSDPVHKISILPRGMALGYTLQLPTEDKYLESKTALVNEICVLLGGRAAEELMFDDITTGASNDIERATRIARRMVTEFGMSESLGPLSFGNKTEAIFLGRDLARERDYSEEVAARIDGEVRNIVESCHSKVKEMLSSHKERLELVADKLIEREFLEGIRLESLLEGNDLSEEEIERLEQEKKRIDEEKNKARIEEKEAKEKEELAAAAEKIANESQASVSGEEKTDAAPDEKESGADMRALEIALERAGGLTAGCYRAVKKAFGEITAPFLENERMKLALGAVEELIKGSQSKAAELALKRLVRESDEGALEAGFRLRLAMLYTALGRADRAAEEITAALYAASEKLGVDTEKALVGAVGFLRIFNEEFSRKKVSFASFINDRVEIEKIEKRFQEWEKKAGEDMGGFFSPTA